MFLSRIVHRSADGNDDVYESMVKGRPAKPPFLNFFLTVKLSATFHMEVDVQSQVNVATHWAHTSMTNVSPHFKVQYNLLEPRNAIIKQLHSLVTAYSLHESRLQ